MDTQYTQGFKAGMVWREIEIIKLLEDSLKGCSVYDCERCDEVKGLSSAIALIKGETSDLP